MGEMNDKMQEVSKALLGMRVKDVFKKDGLKLRELSTEDKDQIRNLYKNLEQQVNEFVNRSQAKKESVSPETVEKAKRTRRTLRDKVRKKK
ncbi:hypothetical protein EKG37_00845 [Robertmurraya yapensis]|uniref:Spore coat protein n=2 Tax=Bacillaceae TaxID=186817 RepID=A0A3S0KQS3_9BACI|nr:hypothetical protein [Bacillus yapensis]RTR36138.1 hypothetical protein EKG37_00845 [Bacillus yapensis]TKT05641.1 hypothetical protein FAR12_00845 [Bacillus yapensis]